MGYTRGAMAGPESAAQTAKERASKKPLLIVKPGVGEWRHTFSGLEESLRDNGVSAIVGDPAEIGRTAELRELFHVAKAQAREMYRGKADAAVVEYLLDSIPLSLFRGALSVIHLIEDNRADPAHPLILAGHSMGAAEIAIAAFLRPDLPVKKLILINPASWTGKREHQSPYLQAAEALNKKKKNTVDAMFASQWRAARLAIRVSFALFVAEFLGSLFRKGEKHARMLGAIHDGALYLAERIGGQIFAEAHGVANFDALAYLDFLHGMNTGLSVDVIYDENDLVFPARLIRERVEEGKGKRDWLRLHQTKGFGHYGPVKDPKYFADLLRRLTGS